MAVLTNLRVGVSPLCAALQVTPIILTRTNGKAPFYGHARCRLSILK